MGQAVGVDPFALAGWVAPIGNGSARLRVYGTLGNPNFVAAVLVATTPLTVSLLTIALRAGARRRGLAVSLAGALALQVAGAIATGSRAGALGLFAAAMTWAALGPGPGSRSQRRTRIAVATLGCALALATIAVSTARPLGQTLAGRAYILRVSWPHAWEAPWAGRGPGAFELLYPAWERDSRETQRDQREQLGPPDQPDRPDRPEQPDQHSQDSRRSQPFAGPQQHAHNDYLEALIDRGLLGPVTILFILATCITNGWRHARRTHDASIAAGAVSMLAALAAIACVDFPLARPTELTWWWCGVALISLTKSGDADGTFSGVKGEVDVGVDVGADMGPDGPGDRPGSRHGGRGGPRG
jgi:O-antigen ligase